MYLTLLQLEQTAGSSGRRGTGPPTEPGLSQDLLHRYYLNWTKLDDDITEFNNEMHLTEKWAFNLVILH